MQNKDFWRALGNTMLLGLVGATATMVLGGIVAYVSVRTNWRGRRLIDARLAALDDARHGARRRLPVGLCHAARPDPDLRHDLGAAARLYGARHADRGARDVRHYHQLSFDLEECSRVHGASWWQTLWRILIALAWPSFAVGWMLTFFGIMRELWASILLYSVGSEVLSVVLCSSCRRSGRAGQRDRPDDDVARDLLPLGAASMVKQRLSMG